jgi:hypothetical protein
VDIEHTEEDVLLQHHHLKPSVRLVGASGHMTTMCVTRHLAVKEPHVFQELRTSFLFTEQDREEQLVSNTVLPQHLLPIRPGQDDGRRVNGLLLVRCTHTINPLCRSFTALTLARSD